MTQLTPMQTFEEKVKTRLKETIADMLPDEALAALEVVELAKPIIEEYAKKEFERRRADVDAAISDLMKSDALMIITQATLMQQTQRDLVQQMFNMVSELKSQMGMR